MNSLLGLVQMLGEFLDLVGVVVILSGATASTLFALREAAQRKSSHTLYKSFRQNLGRSILLGLEFLVAGDVIRSVTGVPNFTSVGVLVIVVLVRSFLSFTFEMEIEGHWPWQRTRERHEHQK